MKESKQRQSQIPFSLALQLFCLLLLLPQCVAHCDWCKQFANGPVTQQGTFQVVVGQNASTNPATMCKETTIVCGATYVSVTRILSVQRRDGSTMVIKSVNNSGESLSMVATCSHMAYWEYKGVPLNGKVCCEEGPPVSSTSSTSTVATTKSPGNGGDPCDPPSTASPTTADPSTASPTTADPSTASPTTAPPGFCLCPCTSSTLSSMMTTPSSAPSSPQSTAAPSTASPTTAAPSTASPTTADPSTASPTTADPSTASPTTAPPSTTSPTTAAPSTASPTTASTTTPPTTTRACPAGGTWSAWATGPCSATCGACGKQQLTRRCMSAPGCPCTGPAQQTGQTCGMSPCIFPANSCCTPFRATAAAGKIVCGT